MAISRDVRSSLTLDLARVGDRQELPDIVADTGKSSIFFDGSL